MYNIQLESGGRAAHAQQQRQQGPQFQHTSAAAAACLAAVASCTVECTQLQNSILCRELFMIGMGIADCMEVTAMISRLHLDHYLCSTNCHAKCSRNSAGTSSLHTLHSSRKCLLSSMLQSSEWGYTYLKTKGCLSLYMLQHHQDQLGT